MMRRLAGDASLEQLGSEFNLDPRTVQRRLALARTDGVLEQARKVFVSDMLPQAMIVLQEALAGDDIRLAVDVAKHIVTGLKAMESLTPSSAAPAQEETFEQFRERITLTRTVTAVGASGGAHPVGLAQPPAATVDAEVLSVSPAPALPSAPPPPAPAEPPASRGDQPAGSPSDRREDQR